MNKKRRKKKTIVLPILAAVVMLLSTGTYAQDPNESFGGGLFGLGSISEWDEMLVDEGVDLNESGLLNQRGGNGGYSLFNQRFGADGNGGYDLYNQTFGQDNDGPLDGGWLVFVAATAGYAALKSRKKNQKSNK